MLINHDHPLVDLEPGFRLKESLVRSTIDLIPLPLPKLRPLRDHIPYTEGRLEGWKLVEHVQKARELGWPGIKLHEFAGRTLVICGGGPSIGEIAQLKQIRALQKRGAKVLAINRTHDWLITKGIVPWAGILLDPVPAVASYITPRRGIRYYIGSQCHPSTFSVFDKPDIDKAIWHASSLPELDELLTPSERLLCVPANGSTCGLRSILLGYMLGFRETHLFGMDSSYVIGEDGYPKKDSAGKPQLHAYAKPEGIHDVKQLVIPYPDGEKTYLSNTMMCAQADEFQQFLLGRDKGLTEGYLQPHSLYVHGSGAIPDIARFYGLHFEQRKQVKNEGLHARL